MKEKSIVIIREKNGRFKVDFVGDNISISHFHFNIEGRKVFCIKCGIEHFDFDNDQLNEKGTKKTNTASH